MCKVSRVIDGARCELDPGVGGGHTCAGNESLSQVVVGVFRLQICRSVQFFSLVKKFADLIDLFEDLMVSLIQKTLNSAARWTFSSLG